MTDWLWSIPPDVFPAAVRTGTLALRRQGRGRLAELARGDKVYVYLPGRQVVAGAFEVVSAPFEDTTALTPGRHLPHRVRVRPISVLPEEVWIPKDGLLDKLRVIDDYPEPSPEARFRRVVQRVLHPLPRLDAAVLDFLIQARSGSDPEALESAVEAVRQARDADRVDRPASVASSSGSVVAEPEVGYVAPAAFDRDAALGDLVDALDASGFRYAPWIVAAYVAALRTKPFVLLAGVTGVGKSRLPVLVAEATGGVSTVLPVRPDWTDPAETIGYRALDGRFRAGAVLRAAHAATGANRAHVLVLDEMNLARPEHYLAEVLSRIEQRTPAPDGFETPPLVSESLDPADALWQSVRLPPALAFVGTVNVDESAHAFSRKVLDRAFVLELETHDLGTWNDATVERPDPTPWPLAAWTPRAVRLGTLHGLTEAEREAVGSTARAVAEADKILAPADLGVGYRARDEAALFVLHAQQAPSVWIDGSTGVDPVDVALLTKMLPRIDGARSSARTAAAGLLGWALDGRTVHLGEAERIVDDWIGAARPGAIPDARFPRTAARLARIVAGALDDGVVSFWA